ncbi:hypothetical protein GCM10010168_05200 [Actinoplanes ianthinogenes]|uniref:Methyltransferase n=1 Tax=Actinoplanes ianthinogenes TaxID=122358 RepID=A0ABM7LTT7_9ACTN|nr:hypothetical protein Aiant_33960 [Actinoplanes ianthinogenes]GGQ92546.1 hypothetical protein GCM10010168_05200 [Actinoplanes ianthinogenes]
MREARRSLGWLWRARSERGHPLKPGGVLVVLCSKLGHPLKPGRALVVLCSELGHPLKPGGVLAVVVSRARRHPLESAGVCRAGLVVLSRAQRLA